jgi:phage/plasmid-associated DNA primase
MKKSLVAVLLLVVFMFIVGCVDYKAYDLETDPSADEDLLNEIAQVEDNLAQNQNDEVMENETVLPDLDAKNVLIDGEVQSVYVKENELLDLLVVVSDPDGDIVANIIWGCR